MKSLFEVYLLLVVALCVKTIECARILAVFPVPSISHQIVFRPLTQELAKRGHEVVIITPDPAFPKGKTPSNLTEIDVHKISYDIWKERFVNLVDGKSMNRISLIEYGLRAFVEIFDAQISTKEIKQLLKSKQKFDLILTEACVRVALSMSSVFEAPIIQVSSFGSIPPNYQTIGVPTHPLLVPELVRKRIYNLSLWEKIVGTYENIYIRYLVYNQQELENDMIRRHFGSSALSVQELTKKVDMLFLNINSMWEDNISVPPNLIHMGGLHQKSQKELPDALKSHLDKSVHGVIYMSFGTNVNPSLLPSERIKIFTKVFSKLPYDVLWKWDSGDVQDKPKNVQTSKWFPQSDLLRHPKIKLFITQGGLQSTDEAITAGVPLLAFPMLGDQWYNAEKYVHHGIGLQLDLETITEESLEKAIKTIIQNDRYRQNIKRLSRWMSDQPQSPLERAVWWTEYVIRHGGAKHLQSPLANLSWSEYLMADVVAVITAGLITATLVLGFLAKVFVSAFKGDSEKLKRN